MEDAEPRRAAEEFRTELMKLVLEFTHQDWDITTAEVIGQIELVKALIIKSTLEATDEEPDQDSDR